VLLDLLKLLASQIEKEVSLNEISQHVLIDVKTVKRYIDLLVKSYVIFPLTPFSKNLRSEISGKNKYYFYDTGVRNGIINNFNRLDSRNDVGALLENCIIAERLKKTKIHENFYKFVLLENIHQGKIDLIKESQGRNTC
jgi:predicted AAA+ superfamily ATPase